MHRVVLATASDSGEIASLDVRAWQAAYKDVVPEHVLASLEVEKRRSFWAQVLGHPTPQDRVLVTRIEERITGFCLLGPSNDYHIAGLSPGPNTGEIFSLYVSPDNWGEGIGRSLLGEATAEMRALGFVSAVCWLLERNQRGRRFAELNNWAPDGATNALAIGVEVRYRRSLALA